MNLRSLFLATFILTSFQAFGQTFSRADSLRGTLGPLRSCYDVTFYELEVKLNAKEKRLAGSNTFHFRATRNFNKLQFDLFSNLAIAKILYHGEGLGYGREHNAVFVEFPETIQKGALDSFTVIYGGEPIEAERPPWDGGIVWKEDKYGLPFLGVACQGMGASAWWPVKDHLSDEPDSMSVSIIVPDYLMAVSNGNLRSRKKLAGNFNRWEWFINYPINSYGVSFYVGDYVHFSEPYANGDSKYNLDYYVLADNEEVAREHFKQVTPMLKIFEKYFGPYPFPKDGYALVETNYWGMEHQSAVAYGNEFNNMPEYDFDFIIIHESLHEWFGNSLSMKDNADMWIHEAFTTYGEWVYIEERYDYDKAVQYALGQRRRIVNKIPLVGPRDVNFDNWPAADIYFKGAWMLHSLRNTVNNDSLWFATLYDFAVDHRLKFLETEEVISYFNQKLGADYSTHFEQFLFHKDLPVLEMKFSGKGKNAKFHYRWNADVEAFSMPVDAKIKGDDLRLTPKVDWQHYQAKNLKADDVELGAGNFLYEIKLIEN